MTASIATYWTFVPFLAEDETLRWLAALNAVLSWGLTVWTWLDWKGQRRQVDGGSPPPTPDRART